MVKILIADDSKFMRNVLRDNLKDEKCEIVGEARNGVEAVHMTTKLKPDVIFLDITMPELSGIDALKLINKINPKVKIIMCSAMGHKFFIKEAIQNGADDFIIKPFQKEKIIESLNKVLAKED